MRPYVINPPYFTLLEMCLRKVAHYHRCILIAVEEARLANLPPPVYKNEGGGIKTTMIILLGRAHEADH